MIATPGIGSSGYEPQAANAGWGHERPSHSRKEAWS
jgi:hypothetical protein